MKGMHSSCSKKYVPAAESIINVEHFLSSEKSNHIFLPPCNFLYIFYLTMKCTTCLTVPMSYLPSLSKQAVVPRHPYSLQQQERDYFGLSSHPITFDQLTRSEMDQTWNVWILKEVQIDITPWSLRVKAYTAQHYLWTLLGSWHYFEVHFFIHIISIGNNMESFQKTTNTHSISCFPLSHIMTYISSTLCNSI